MNTGYIKFYRKTLENPIIWKPYLLQLFVYCLLRANHKPNRIIFNDEEVTIRTGEFVTGLKVISRDLKLNQNSAYKRLQQLQKIGYISIKSNNKYSIIRIENFSKYQSRNDVNASKGKNGNNTKSIENIEVFEGYVQKSKNQVKTREKPSKNQVKQTRMNKNEKNEEEENSSSFCFALIELLSSKIWLSKDEVKRFINKLFLYRKDLQDYQKELLLIKIVGDMSEDVDRKTGYIVNKFRETNYQKLSSEIEALNYNQLTTIPILN